MSDTNDSQKIIDCPHCGKAISATSEKCPYCQQEIKPSSSASGTDTSGIKDNASKNDKITENIMKPENTTNRPVRKYK